MELDVWSAERDLVLPDGRVLRYAGRRDTPNTETVRSYRAGWCALGVEVSGDGGAQSLVTVRLDYAAIAEGEGDALVDVQVVADLFYGEGKVHAIWGLPTPDTVTLVPSASWGGYLALLGVEYRVAQAQ